MGKRGKHSKKVFNDFRTQANNDLVELEEKKVLVQPKTEGQKRYIHEIATKDIVICEGPAGTGKTNISIGLGLQNILGKNAKYEKIVVLRPATEACEEHIGFLPGEVENKLSPYIAPFVDNMLVYLNQSKIDYLLKSKKIEAIPLAFCRGRSLNNAFIILDEAQNCSSKQLLMVLTRIGENSKLVINGDTTQNDRGVREITGLQDAIERLDGMNKVGIVQLDGTDIVRNPLIAEIIRRYSQ